MKHVRCESLACQAVFLYPLLTRVTAGLGKPTHQPGGTLLGGGEMLRFALATRWRSTIAQLQQSLLLPGPESLLLNAVLSEEFLMS